MVDIPVCAEVEKKLKKKRPDRPEVSAALPRDVLGSCDLQLPVVAYSGNVTEGNRTGLVGASTG